jgi:putative holliday junction resolvase
MPARTYLGFDYGTRRIGVAVGQSVTRTATALCTLEVRDGRIDWPAIAGLVAEWRPDGLVVGRPDPAGERPHPLGPAIERFARRLAGRYRLPVAFVDERLSSYAAGRDGQPGAAGLDAAAARHILESWLALPEQLSQP